jgi:hypothetical protein
MKTYPLAIGDLSDFLCRLNVVEKDSLGKIEDFDDFVQASGCQDCVREPMNASDSLLVAKIF